jgi:hypothetical protein
MSEKPKRKFWQFSLTTALLLALLISWLLFMNLYSEPSKQEIHQQHYGWPFAAVQRNVVNGRTVRWYVEDANLYGDLAIALQIFLVVALISEWLIRRREARKA